jgi:hypothetical protein
MGTGDENAAVDRQAFSLVLPGKGASEKIRIKMSACTGTHIMSSGGC